MTRGKLETLVWVMIYGGLLGASLGWFMRPQSDALGWTLIAGGGVVTVIGAVLIFVRSRMNS